MLGVLGGSMIAMPDYPYHIFPDPEHLPELPEALLKEGTNFYNRLKTRASAEEMEVFDSRPELLYVLSMSDFVAKTLIQYPSECARLIKEGALEDPTFNLDCSDEVKERIVKGLSEMELKKRLRIIRRTRMVSIAWRDLTGCCDIEEVFVSLSNLAELIVMRTIKVVREELYQVFGNAYDNDGKEMPLLVLGMGKLGGGELNFSSDIDIMCCYPYDGDTKGGTRVITHQEYFTKVVQRLNNLLSDITSDSFCYRIDLRLRPFGEAGPLVSTFDALTVYYETQGRTWERYALVKAKLLGDHKYWQPYGDEMIELLRPFVYRRYLDYGAIESLRKLKHMIEAEVRRRNLHENFKLGSGGIREVEFIAQVFELMRGGRIPELAERSLRKTLRNIGRLQLLPEKVTARLDICYIYLRRLENVTQMLADKQTQNLPTNENDKIRVALSMGKSSYEELLTELEEIRSEVHNEFVSVMRDEEDEKEQEDSEAVELWESTLTAQELATVLTPMLTSAGSDPYASPAVLSALKQKESLAFAQAIVKLRLALARLPVGPKGRDSLLRLMPKIIRDVAKYPTPALLFSKVALLIEKVALRTTYLQLLVENESTRSKLLSILNSNDFAGSLISAHPILLDELIAPRYFTAPPKPDEYMAWLNERLLRIDPEDLEEQMEELRLFKKVMVLRIALSDQSQSLPLMKISDSLTWLAEAILREIGLLAWRYTENKYGAPADLTVNDPGYAIIAYGKLGGIELGYRSDLDMVFIRESSDSMTKGTPVVGAGANNGANGEGGSAATPANQVSTTMFYQRFVQRFMHLCTTRMSGGVLYELDMRLRPDGDSGVLMTDLEAYEQYQKHRAWTWEHQALVRARAVAGSPKVIEGFNKIRDSVLRTPRDEVKLIDDVYAMRMKMKNFLDRSSDKLFDLKQGRGGMVDIEFIAQYLLLREAPKHADMVLWSDNVRIFDECARLGILSQEETDTLKNAYLDIRECYHRVSLANLPRIVAIEDRPAACVKIEKIFNDIFKEAAERFVPPVYNKTNSLPFA